ncbi:MAG: YceI family protein [Anaerolineae bacterium]|nr:YceI family protein [Anaerolineae bacterium]
MTRRILTLIAGAALAGVLVVIAIGVYLYVSGGSGEASEDVNENAQQLSADSPSEMVFRIVQDESRVSFILEEDLRGVRTTVIGTTNDVAGDIQVDLENPANTQIGAIRINLRTLATDNDFRNRAIRSEILQSARDEYEFTEFIPTAIEGLPETVSVGQPFTFQVTGDLKLVDTTRSVTFEVTVTPVSEERLEGTGTATVLRSDYGLKIPDVPSVANVTDEVQLTIDFVAVAVANDGIGS